MSGIECGRCNHKTQITSFALNFLEQSKKNIGVQVSLMGLVDHHNSVSREQWIGENLTHQCSIGEKLDLGTFVVMTALVKPNTITNFIAKHSTTFFCNLTKKT